MKLIPFVILILLPACHCGNGSKAEKDNANLKKVEIVEQSSRSYNSSVENIQPNLVHEKQNKTERLRILLMLTRHPVNQSHGNFAAALVREMRRKHFVVGKINKILIN